MTTEPEQPTGGEACKVTHGTCERHTANNPGCVLAAGGEAVEALARWYVEFDGPAHPTGREFAQALLASGWLANHSATVAAEAVGQVVERVRELCDQFDRRGSVATHLVRAALAEEAILIENPYSDLAGDR